MNKVQHGTLIGGLLLIFLAGLFPPITNVIRTLVLIEGPGGLHQEWSEIYETAGRRFLVVPWLTSKGSTNYRIHYYRIDYYRLSLEWLTTAALVGAVFLFAQRWKR